MINRLSRPPVPLEQTPTAGPSSNPQSPFAALLAALLSPSVPRSDPRASDSSHQEPNLFQSPGNPSRENRGLLADASFTPTPTLPPPADNVGLVSPSNIDPSSLTIVDSAGLASAILGGSVSTEFPVIPSGTPAAISNVATPDEASDLQLPVISHSGASIEDVSTAHDADLHFVPDSTEPEILEETDAVLAPLVAIDAHQIASVIVGATSGVAMQMPTIQLRLHQQSGSVEIVSVPWRLSANDELSQFIEVVLNAPAAAVVAGSTVALSPPQAGRLVEGEYGESHSWASTEHTGHGLGSNAQHAAEEIERSEELHLSTSPLVSSAGELWLKRLARLLEHHGQGQTIWIRDYSLESGAAQSVADSLRLFAQQNGIRLGRIVVNAQELWSAGSNANVQGDI